ncbi:MAG: hypothetical protein RSE46_22455, partial [Janthinobacterium sp.]
MSINALSSTSAASQLNAFSRLGGGSSSNVSNTSGVDGARPPKPDDGAFLDAISSALSSIGVTDLQSSFASLLGALGGDEGGSGSGKLSSFLQALSGSLSAASAGGSLSASGNLV